MLYPILKCLIRSVHTLLNSKLNHHRSPVVSLNKSNCSPYNQNDYPI